MSDSSVRLTAEQEIDSSELLAAEKELADAQKELAWELSKAAVDAAGVVDPTPISDVVGAGMSLSDGDLIGAGLSLISIVPYVGDALGKVAKGARAAKKIARLRKIIAGATAKVEKLRRAKKAARAAKRAVGKAKKLTKKKPRPRTRCRKVKIAKEVIEKRKKLAFDFYKKHGFKEARIRQHMKGIDFNEPVEVVKLRKGDKLVQYQIPDAPQGNYYTIPGTPPSKVGISPKGLNKARGKIVPKKALVYEVTEDIEVLKTTTKSVPDTWSIPGRVIKTKGGGTQFFTTDRSSLKLVAGK